VATRHLVEVRERFFPPSVDCVLGNRSVRLTPASTTTRWARIWIGGWCALGVSPVLLLVGRLRRRPGVSPR
jgi:hypothetical protein